MNRTTLVSYYNSSAFDPPESETYREILERNGDYLEETLDYIDRYSDQIDRNDIFDLADKVDATNRAINADLRKASAKQRLCRIIAGMYTRAVIAGDIDECDRLADALVLATRTWCNG